MSNPEILIRQAGISDLIEMQQLFVHTIRAICSNDYSKEQITAWTSSVKNTGKWINKLKTQYFLVAQSDQKIVGYASLENNDYFDFLYVHRDHQKQGIDSRLCSEIESEALRRKATVIHSFASKTAKPFFEKKGYVLTEVRNNIILGIEIVNYKMTKTF